MTVYWFDLMNYKDGARNRKHEDIETRLFPGNSRQGYMKVKGLKIEVLLEEPKRSRIFSGNEKSFCEGRCVFNSRTVRWCSSYSSNSSVGDFTSSSTVCW